MRIITVHGTFAGDVSDEGSKWWQKGSRFCTALQRKYPKASVEPFQWKEGPNSEMARREAGRNLYDRLIELEQQSEHYILIGHSHGGSVIYSALLHSAGVGHRLQRLCSWITIGTPFLDFQRKRSFLSRLNAIELAVLVWSIGYLAIPTSIFVGLYRDANALNALSPELMAFLNLVIGPVYGLSLFVGIAGLLLLDRRRRRFANEKSKIRVADWYEGLWKGFCHPDDEALAALRVAQNFSTRLVRKDYLVPTFSTFGALLSILVIAAACVVFSMSSDVPAWLLALDKNLQSQQIAFVAPTNTSQALLLFLAVIVSILLCVLGIWFGSSAYVEFSRLIGLAVGLSTYARVNSYVWMLIKEKTWGADTSWEYVASVSDRPPEFSQMPSLTVTAMDEISDECDRYASLVVSRLRGALGSSAAIGTPQDMLALLLDNSDWRGLIHTSYFDVDGAAQEIIAAVELAPNASK